jgi:hypothetical protein
VPGSEIARRNHANDRNRQQASSEPLGQRDSPPQIRLFGLIRPMQAANGLYPDAALNGRRRDGADRTQPQDLFISAKCLAMREPPQTGPRDHCHHRSSALSWRKLLGHSSAYPCQYECGTSPEHAGHNVKRRKQRQNPSHVVAS